MASVAYVGTVFLWTMRALFGLALIVPMLSYGAVDFEPLSIVAMLVSGVAILTCWRGLRARSIALIASVALLCLSAVILVEYIQSLRLANFELENPAWKYVRELIGPVDGAISVIPEQTWAVIIAWSPILAFVAALHLFNRTAEAFSLLKALCHLGILVTVVSLVQYLFFPGSLGVGAKEFYLGSLTGLYVNRNSAGTFFGVGLIVTLGLIVFELQGSGYKDLFWRVIARARLSRAERSAVYLMIGGMLEALALAATQSRGAAASTFIAILILIWLFNRRSEGTPRRRTWAKRRGRWIQITIVACASFSLAVLIGQEAIYRMDAQSVDQARLCTYASTWRAIVDNWPLGAGFGSFQDVFPAYRTPECSGIDGVWDAAHDSYLEGILGLGATFVVVVTIGYVALIWAFVRGLRDRRNYRFASAIGLASLALVSIHSLVDFSMQIPGNALSMAALWAGCVTVSLAKQTTRSRSTPGDQPETSAYGGNPASERPADRSLRAGFDQIRRAPHLQL